MSSRTRWDMRIICCRLSLREIVRRLQIEPKLGCRSEMLRETERCIGADRALLAHDVRNTIVRNVENISELPRTHTGRHEAFLAQNLARMRPDPARLPSGSRRFRHLPVLVLSSGNTHATDRLSELSAGLSGYL